MKLIRRPGEIGEEIRRARKEKNWTQEELADRANLRQETISRIENGAEGTSLDTVLALFAALDYDLEVKKRSESSIDSASENPDP